MKKLSFQPIGTIHSPFETKEDCPIQNVYSSDAKGTVELLEIFAEGLKDIDTFSHIILLYVFNQAGEIKLVRQTFLMISPTEFLLPDILVVPMESDYQLSVS